MDKISIEKNIAMTATLDGSVMVGLEDAFTRFIINLKIMILSELNLLYQLRINL